MQMQCSKKYPTKNNSEKRGPGSQLGARSSSQRSPPSTSHSPPHTGLIYSRTLRKPDRISSLSFRASVLNILDFKYNPSIFFSLRYIYLIRLLLRGQRLLRIRERRRTGGGTPVWGGGVGEVGVHSFIDTMGKRWYTRLIHSTGFWRQEESNGQ